MSGEHPVEPLGFSPSMVGAALLVVYVLSPAPVSWACYLIRGSDWDTGDVATALRAAYFPLNWACERISAVGRFYGWYMDVCGVD